MVEREMSIYFDLIMPRLQKPKPNALHILISQDMIISTDTKDNIDLCILDKLIALVFYS